VVCHPQVATFAQTTLGQRAVAGMLPAAAAEAAAAALRETAAVDALEAEFAADLDFGGIQTAQAGQALARAARGGMLSGTGLQAVASLLVGAAKLQRAARVAAREAESTGCTGLQPVTEAFKARAACVSCLAAPTAASPSPPPVPRPSLAWCWLWRRALASPPSLSRRH
jgi:dsDNA-specific endonuclease/ATPase MutS2